MPLVTKSVRSKLNVEKTNNNVCIFHGESDDRQLRHWNWMKRSENYPKFLKNIRMIVRNEVKAIW